MLTQTIAPFWPISWRVLGPQVVVAGVGLGVTPGVGVATGQAKPCLKQTLLQLSTPWVVCPQAGAAAEHDPLD